jgi:hypothetical protein
MKHKFTKNNLEEVKTTYPVVGAGYVTLGRNANSICGGRAGIHLGVSWSRFGEEDDDVGGVISREHAKELADRIYKMLDDCEMSEEEFYNKNMVTYKWDPNNI